MDIQNYLLYFKIKLIYKFANMLEFFESRNFAEQLYQNVINLSSKYQGSYGSLLADSYIGLGRLSLNNGKIEESELLLEKALKFYERNKSIGLAICYADLGDAFFDEGREDEAEGFYRRALYLYGQLTDKNPKYKFKIAGTQNNLGIILIESNPKESECLFQSALQNYRTYPKNKLKCHPEIAGVLTNLGNLFEASGRIHEAKDKYREALEIYKKFYSVFKQDFAPYVVLGAENLSKILRKTGEDAEAEKIEIEMRFIQNKIVSHHS